MKTKNICFKHRPIVDTFDSRVLTWELKKSKAVISLGSFLVRLHDYTDCV